MKSKGWVAVVGWLVSSLWGVAASAEPAARAEVVVGVFLPISVADGEQRFQIAQQLAGSLQQSLGAPVEGRSFGRFEDFTQALNSGEITLGVVDGWVAGQLPPGISPLAVGQAAGDKQRVQLVSKEKKTVPALKGARLAVVRGATGQEAKLLSNLFFQGDLPAPHFKLVPVPNAESALEALQAGAADAAVLPVASSSGLEAAYIGPSLPTALLVYRKPVPAKLREALLKVRFGPVDRLVPARGDELDDLRVLARRGPPARTPVLADTPVERFDLELLNVAALEPILPRFTPQVRAPQETPDD
ncbi:MAG: hypothetical protein M3Y59_12370 [Myxococcota bacterium]|nr:hypothetical protein [Myxococcota bacterium]